ncbi:hypothetical protein IQ215_09560 [Cyanobacterium stanieri LEGE 03274]|uniref:Lipocalin-like domain-containing protein n=1 Tax=Cyanobacterium stanieri LEGE 03274 TaxID=1828756 RepID=A0ABR9V5X3_9CHRO|nr:hypothetical protein [Cyanobacterium stanieri]MBE9222939.1 hypothetical protein [Cyanobacterium stanieri LEGE 03274]
MKLISKLSRLVSQYRFFILLTVLIPLIISNPLWSRDAQAQTSDKLIGQWRSHVQFITGGFAEVKDLEFMYSFNLGGTMTESSNYDGAPPVPPAYGIWRQLDENEFQAKYEYYATQPPENATMDDVWGGWIPSTRGVLTENITLNDDGKSFISTITYEAFDKDNNLVVDGGGIATGKGMKLAFD